MLIIIHIDGPILLTVSFIIQPVNHRFFVVVAFKSSVISKVYEDVVSFLVN